MIADMLARDLARVAQGLHPTTGQPFRIDAPYRGECTGPLPNPLELGTEHFEVGDWDGRVWGALLRSRVF